MHTLRSLTHSVVSAGESPSTTTTETQQKECCAGECTTHTPSVFLLFYTLMDYVGEDVCVENAAGLLLLLRVVCTTNTVAALPAAVLARRGREDDSRGGLHMTTLARS